MTGEDPQLPSWPVQEDDMPGAMKKMGVYLGLVEDDDPFVDGAESYDRAPARMDPRADPRADYGPETRPARHVEHAPPTREWAAEHDNYQGEFVEEYPTYRITTLHPRTYNEARNIGEHFRSSTPVIMNLSEMDDADAKRLVDFAAGLTFGLHGRIERVTAKVFLLSPHNVTVTAQDKARIVEGGFFNQS
jgi:cell division inhibitor SepF